MLSGRDAQALLKENFHFCENEGVFYWKNPKVGFLKDWQPAGALDSFGYIEIQCLSLRTRAHRACWVWVHGEWPDGIIDHINRVKTDNKISNLRVVSRRQNAQNSSVRKTSAIKLKGVCLDKRDGSFYSLIRKEDGKRKYLGRFNSAIDAHHAYMNEWRSMNPEIQDVVIS